MLQIPELYLLVQIMENTVIEIPFHLKQYIAKQDYSLYTPIDHASWRYIMRVSKEFFKEHAHPKYLDGLNETGVTVERIPRISEMDQKLQKFGWRAVIVTGFIPPEPFLEMLANRILPIAADMRKLENIDYTPSPDIVHEAAGHAPILSDPDYSSYLKKFGEISRKVIFAKEDNDLYEAILDLSETKENPQATETDINRAQNKLDQAIANVGYVSEAQQVTRLGWWSTEYGLFQQEGKFLIYGAGLLSSIGESYNCLSNKVKKIPLTIECIETSYDITKPQPQLFVTDNFKKLEAVIDQLSEKMAYKQGGIVSLDKAKKAQTVTTTVLNTGIQVSGILEDYRINNKGAVYFLKYKGASQLSVDGIQVIGHGADYHKEGFSSPIGGIKGLAHKPWLASNEDWHQIGCQQGAQCQFEFESGIRVEGLWKSSLKINNNTLILSFENCTSTLGNEVLFSPTWGTFDIILGESIISVFGGASDRDAYSKHVQTKEFHPRAQKSNLTDENQELGTLYSSIREIREQGQMNGEFLDKILRVKSRLDAAYPQDWLLRLEILEILTRHQLRKTICDELKIKLLELASESERMEMLIRRGFALVN